jgi:hypothetical protein
MSVSIEELLLECGANGRVSGIFWDRKMVLSVLFETWPDGTFGRAHGAAREKARENRGEARHGVRAGRAKSPQLLADVHLVRQAGSADLRKPEPHLPLADAALFPRPRRDLWPRPRDAGHADDQDAQHRRAAAAAGGGDRHAGHLHRRRRRRVQPGPVAGRTRRVLEGGAATAARAARRCRSSRTRGSTSPTRAAGPARRRQAAR